jgi:hypothetical protein
MANALQLSSRCFVQYYTFPLIAFDALVRNHIATFIYVRCKFGPVDAAHTAIVTKENLRILILRKLSQEPPLRFTSAF